MVYLYRKSQVFSILSVEKQFITKNIDIRDSVIFTDIFCIVDEFCQELDQVVEKIFK
jgi:hypothetical protein